MAELEPVQVCGPCTAGRPSHPMLGESGYASLTNHINVWKVDISHIEPQPDKRWSGGSSIIFGKLNPGQYPIRLEGRWPDIVSTLEKYRKTKIYVNNEYAHEITGGVETNFHLIRLRYEVSWVVPVEGYGVINPIGDTFKTIASSVAIGVAGSAADIAKGFSTDPDAFRGTKEATTTLFGEDSDQTWTGISKDTLFAASDVQGIREQMGYGAKASDVWDKRAYFGFGKKRRKIDTTNLRVDIHVKYYGSKDKYSSALTKKLVSAIDCPYLLSHSVTLGHVLGDLHPFVEANFYPA